ncbi:phosphoglycerate kinase [Pseudomonas syringae pv. tomato]|uniref:Phosphoglycerate kinase n=2 Tax=Pseudomonas TaxID=286 RepID=A0AB36KL01_PSEUB|nr:MULTISPECIES: histidine phosphatase family protein [Pseudomonas]MEE3923658.1 histidine phosphatase family protein [Pseudomonas viridiflava]MBD8269318.1 histidine phosphatase family protein [Pseudomonas fluorescens]MBI6850898.1 histidine phosphatase family protein [Pseudomonas syringae]MBX6508811.1 histidine phosphatase family protein [Pseudomonas syringae pv. tomato]MEE3930219.1 histidine phosphatase family protein [Pseudomonas viridiflava]
MKHVRLIRHGESAANAGEASLDHATIPLTARGIEQARLVAKSIVNAPDLIVASPFSRAHATAMATVTAFSTVPFETWPIHEFTYLEPARCANTTIAQRREWVNAYWSRSDPEFTDGKGAESFLDFITRAQAFLHKLREHPSDDLAVFSHGQFINAVAWLIERQPTVINSHGMTDWREYEIANHVENCGGYRLIYDQGSSGWRLMPKNAEDADLQARRS